MIAFLAVLMAVSVSGCEEVEGILGGNVSLPCSCSGRNTSKEMNWQLSEQLLVFKYDKNVTEFHERYSDRATVLPQESCSLRLTHIKKEDKGEYICVYYIGEIYTDICVNLTVVAHFKVCQSDSVQGKNEKVFHCNVTGHDKEAQIQWFSDGQQLRNSSGTTITHAYTLDTATDLKSFSSNLSTRLNISEPKCEVTNANVQTRITKNCNGEVGRIVQPIQERHRYISIALFVTVAGLFMVLCCYSKFS